MQGEPAAQANHAVLDMGRRRGFESSHSAPVARVHVEVALVRVRGVDCAPSEKSSRPAPMQRVAKRYLPCGNSEECVSRHRHVNTDAPWCRDTGHSAARTCSTAFRQHARAAPARPDDSAVDFCRTDVGAR